MKAFNETLYVTVDKYGNPDYTSLSIQRKECVRNFLSGTSMDWKEAKKYGWSCVKVEVKITDIKK